MKIKYLILGSVSGAVVGLDQLTKAYIYTHYRLYESTNVIPSFFNITYARNLGAAFSFLASAQSSFRQPFFLLVPVLAMTAIIWILRSTLESQKVQVLSLSLIFGGALGNYIDRLRFGYVVDFLDFHWREVYHFAAFNVADSCICIGVGLLLLHRVLFEQPAIEATSKGVTS
jgi:signal peptidase II